MPGVVVGALVLIGLPELLREFAEYRMLMYGALLIVMMLVKPEGFWPSEVMKRELHAHEEHQKGKLPGRQINKEEEKTMSILLKSNAVSKQFGGLVAVNQFDFELPEGKIISIIGPNGAGKTTFFNCITGFYDISAGTD